MRTRLCLSLLTAVIAATAAAQEPGVVLFKSSIE